MIDINQNDPTVGVVTNADEPKDIEFDYLVENINAHQEYYLYHIINDFLNSHDIEKAAGLNSFHFTIETDQFQAQQLLEIITAYVESHYLQMAGGFHVVKEVNKDVQTP